MSKASIPLLLVQVPFFTFLKNMVDFVRLVAMEMIRERARARTPSMAVSCSRSVSTIRLLRRRRRRRRPVGNGYLPFRRRRRQMS
jgi:hypothetical protein